MSQGGVVSGVSCLGESVRKEHRNNWLVRISKRTTITINVNVVGQHRSRDGNSWLLLQVKRTGNFFGKYYFGRICVK